MSAQFDTPSRFGDYELHELASRDLVSSTYRATVRRTSGTWQSSEQVALRIVDADLTAHRRAVDGFLRANRRIATVDHVHLLRVADVGEHGDLPYVATVWRQGTTASEMLDRHGPLPTWVAVRMVGQLAEALDTVHEAGTVHGTVGLSTVWVKHRRRDQTASSALLTGFGTGYLLASLLHRDADHESAGDFAFLAPEQLRGDAAGPAADQYALACLLYTALTGVTPFVGATAEAVFDGHLTRRQPRVADVHESLPADWDDLFDRALAKRPEERFDNCRTLARAAGRCGPPRGSEPDEPVAWAPRTTGTAGGSASPVTSRDADGGQRPSGPASASPDDADAVPRSAEPEDAQAAAGAPDGASRRRHSTPPFPHVAPDEPVHERPRRRARVVALVVVALLVTLTVAMLRSGGAIALNMLDHGVSTMSWPADAVSSPGTAGTDTVRENVRALR